MNGGHLCAGVDGIALGLKEAGVTFDAGWHVEIDPDACRILRVPPLDMTDPNLRVEPVDFLTAGVPCQPVSVQGLKRGKGDKRWLWPFARRMYRMAKPRRIFLENVGNLVRIDGGKLHAEILDNLREDGYAVRWCIVGACSVGAAQHRHRWFLLADHVGPNAPEAVHVPTVVCGVPRSMGHRLLPIPRAGDERRGVEPNRAFRTGTGPTLNDAVGTLPADSWGEYEWAIERHERALGREAPEPIDAYNRLTGEFVEWLMMLPKGWIAGHGLTRANVVRLAGNAVVPAHAALAYRLLDD